METATTIDALLGQRQKMAGTVGFVPTMGALHDGHLSLVRRALEENDHVIVSVFLNPAQFNDPADLDTYPRDLAGDRKRLSKADVDLLFAPAIEAMRPSESKTTIDVPSFASRYEGASRPGHFAGVCQVVAKLFHLARPDRAYFGEKDLQQLRIVTQLARDLSFPLTVVACPTVRDEDGLALSSRNALLSDTERTRAVALFAALSAGKDQFSSGTTRREDLLLAVQRVLSAALTQEDTLDYLDLIDTDSFTSAMHAHAGNALIIAARIGTTRLIDNLHL